MANVFQPDWKAHDSPAPFTPLWAPVGRQAGSGELGASLFELRSGEAICPHVRSQVWPGSDDYIRKIFRANDAVDYYDGER